MPNWTETEMAVVLPSDNAARFLGLFLSQDEKENAGKAEYFGRTFLTDHSEEKNGKGMSCLRVGCECAWSVYSCLFEGFPDGDGGKPHCPTLQEAIEKLGVKRLVIYSKEPDIGFEESVTYDMDEGGKPDYQSRDLYKDPWCECLDDADEAKEEKEMT